MSDDPTDEKCFGCDALMPSFLECCPSCGWERSPEISREARVRALGGGNMPSYVKVLLVVCPIIALVFAVITVTVGPKQSDLDAVILKEPPPIPAKTFWTSHRGVRRRRELEAQWSRYRAQQERFRRAKLENGTTTK